MNWEFWAQFVGQLAENVAKSEGVDERSIGYLRLMTSGIGAVKTTDAELTALRQQYMDEVAADKPVTVPELQALEDEIARRHELIQRK